MYLREYSARMRGAVMRGGDSPNCHRGLVPQMGYSRFKASKVTNMSLELNIPTEVQLLRTVLTALGNESDHLLNEKVVPKTLRVITQMEPYLGDLLIIRSTIRQQILDNSSKKVGDVVGSLVDKALTLYQGLLEVLVVHFGFLPETEHSFKTALRWLRLTCEDRLESYFKIQSCYLFSLVTKQNKLIDELPEFPQWISEFGDRPGYIQGGKLWRMSRKAIATPDLSKHEIAAFYAITNVKRAGLAISEKLQEASILKHQKNMVGAEYKPKAVCPWLPLKKVQLNVSWFPLKKHLVTFLKRSNF